MAATKSGCGGLAEQAEPFVLTRGDVEILDPIGEEQSWDEIDVPALPDDVAFTTGDWLALLKPAGGHSIRSWRTWKRLSGMVAVVSGIALVVVTFTSGRPLPDTAVNLETAALSSIQSENVDDDLDVVPSTLPLALAAGVSPNLLSSAEADFLGLIAAPVESTTSTSTTSTTKPTATTAGWSEPVIPPESEWIDAGNGVAVPDVLLRIRYCESTNNYRAAHSVSSARGAYQFLTRSWEWYGHAARYGAARADLATPAQQDEAAVLTLRRDGTRPWLASWRCWGSDTLPANYATISPPAQPTTTATPAETASSGDLPSTSSTVTSTVPTTVSTETTVDSTSTSAATPTSDTVSTTAPSASSTASTTSTAGSGG